MPPKANTDIKIILMGDSGVGKSSLLNRYINRNFSLIYDATIGIDFGSKAIMVQDKQITLKIWDAAGQESYKDTIFTYTIGSLGCILVCDATNQQSFDNILIWKQGVTSFVKTNLPTFFLLVNKIDQPEKRVITESEVKTFAATHQFAGIFEVSAKTGTGVKEAFTSIATTLAIKLEQNARAAATHSSAAQIGFFASCLSCLCGDDDDENGERAKLTR